MEKLREILRSKKVIIVVGTGILTLGGVYYFIIREKEGRVIDDEIND